MAQLQNPYTGGTATVAVGGTTVTVTGILDDTNCIEGDHFRNPATGYETRIIARVDATHFTIPPWRSTAMTAAGYEIYPDSTLRVSGGRNTATVNQLIQRLIAKGAVWLLPDTFASPTAAGWGADDNQYVYQMGTQQWWRMTGGAWATSGPPSGVPVLVGNNSFSGQQTITNATETGGTTTGALVVTGGIGVGKSVRVGGVFAVQGAATLGSTLGVSGAATFAGVVDVNSTTDANLTGANSGSINTAGGLYVAKTLAVAGGISTGQVVPQFPGVFISARGPGTCIEWAHSNQAGYGSSLGCNQSSGQPWLLFCGSAGTNPNTFRTYGIRGSLIRSDMSGGFIFAALANSAGDNQSESQTASLSNVGQFSPVSLSSIGSTLPVGTTLIASNKGHQFGVNGGTIYTGALANTDPNILFYNISSTNWAGIGTDTSGNVWIRTGTSGTPAAAFAVTPTRTVVIPALGAGTLSTNSSGVISSSSDERLKEVLGDFDRGLAEVRLLRPILYKWNKKSGLADGVTYAGFGAGAVRKVIPEAIGRDDRGYLSLNDRPIIAALVNAVVELDGRLTKLAA
jgi:hypothetical protein